MAKRGVVTDYAGEELHPGDLITYSARESNRVRSADAWLLKIHIEKFKGRCIPFLLVQPTGSESGFARRRSMRKLTISAEHVRLIERCALSDAELEALRSGVAKP